MDKPFEQRYDESTATLQGTDLRDITDLARGRNGMVENDSDWIDPFIRSFRDYLTIEGRQKNKAKGSAKLWTTEEIGSQLLNFLRGAIPMEPTTPEKQGEAMDRLDSRRYTLRKRRPDFKQGVEYVPTPIMNGSIQAYLRSMRQHSQGMGGKI